MKKCCSCDKEKSILEFWKSNNSSDGLQSECKACNIERRKGYSKTIACRYNALKRKGTDLTKDQYIELVSKPCHYCGFSLNETGIGLDQKKPSGGYMKLNVVPCCWICNTAKSHNFTYEEMLQLGQAIRMIRLSRTELQVASVYKIPVDHGLIPSLHVAMRT